MECWEKIQETVQKSISSSAYSSWIAPLSFDKIDLDTIYLCAPTRFIADWVKRNYFSHLLSAINESYPNIKEIKLSVGTVKFEPKTIIEDVKNSEDTLLNIETKPLLENIGTKTSLKFTFDSFVKGDSNALAFESIKCIANQSSVSFNPLVIHSPSGFGKTHLLNALANELSVSKPTLNVIYISADKFMYSFVKALKENDTYRFKQSFKSADILMIDDIQFIAGKESTAKELFHIIDDYITNGKQVIIASNNSPFLIEGLNISLKSRIASGLVVDITPANFDLRKRIVEEKCKALNLTLQAGIGDFIASKISTSIRELEGALNRISAHTILMNEAPTLSNIRKILADILAVNTKPLDIQDIKKAVAEKWGVTVSDIDSERKQKDIVIPRQVAMYIAKNLTSKSLPEIGKSFGGRDHATVIYAVKKVKELMVANPRLENLIKETEQICSNL
ncbi:MAG: chromosomal replication initiator protein DnaA [Alphaproteobacteria bacterium]|nr:chromosomal replication initiator protein DnaA [Alphaproteobacteria bacterium]